jgi:DNA-binding Lrp family transcriptional regulator
MIADGTLPEALDAIRGLLSGGCPGRRPSGHYPPRAAIGYLGQRQVPSDSAKSKRREQMVRAYILMTLEPGKAMDVVQRLRREAGVLQVDAITGEYDAIAQIQADDVKGIGSLIVDRIQSFSGVSRTITCLAVE